MKYLTAKNLLFSILILGFLLRFWGIWNQDIFGDEAADAFRSIGYIDYLGTNFQTQPIDWYKTGPLPWWTKLSFHDFPPMAMIVQNIFFRIFGDSLSAARLPAVVLGVISVYLFYLIIRRLFLNESLALLGGFLFAISGAMAWIFRTSILEPILLFFLILNIYSFLLFLENKRKWWFFGITLGLVALTKYTGIFIIPVYIIYLFLIKKGSPSTGSGTILFPERSRGVLLVNNWRLYAALGLALLLFTPVIIYNIFLYKTTGHFDLQIAYLLGQNTPEWTGLVGKTQAPFSEIWKNITELYGIPFLLASFLGLIYSFYLLIFRRSNLQIVRNFEEVRPPKIGAIIFFWLYLIFSTLLFIKTGSANRFLSLYGPALVFFAAFLIYHLWNFSGGKIITRILKLMVILFLISELFYSINKNILTTPDYGIAKLDNYLAEEFMGKESAVIPEADNIHLNEIINKFAAKKSENAERELMMLVYNDNLALPTIQWIFYRRFFYHNIPALYTENFIKILGQNGRGYFNPGGRSFNLYFIQSTENTLLNPFKMEKTIGADFEKWLQEQGNKPVKTIYGHDNLPMFRIYKFSV